MDMRLPPDLVERPHAAGLLAAEPPPLRLLQRWTPPPTPLPAAPQGWAAYRRALRRLFLAR